MSTNKIHWLGHASIRIEGEKVIYIDPWKLQDNHPKADIILITHSHYDHCSRDDVAKIIQDGTVIFAPPDCRDALPPDFQVVAPGEEKIVDGLVIRTVPAYNIGKHFHPRANEWVGYIIEMGGERIYFVGDSDYIPEMDDISADILIIPVGGTYTMTADEAAQAANQIKPRLAIPIHFGSVVGSRIDADKFKELSQVPVEILPEE
ncbi:MAG: MBL fold metallo-hydrolase [Candidatus Euphemobacter frigidus]|nr:MBL fold metallo-hydrolase [Candidatus Euphemobacter frigidus]MDP8275268.1 MBL fold metallo-hydrolase [Candidatus Euphemobacter frigidus]